jgi:hypothetical protein
MRSKGLCQTTASQQLPRHSNRHDPERILRPDDECLYQPRIHSRRIRELYRIRQQTGHPITVLVDHALAQFLQRRSSEDGSSEADDEEQEGLSDRTQEESRI